MQKKSEFKTTADSPAGSKFVLQGNTAFALGVVHAGYHAADGYPGTPSTEVIDRALAHVQDKISVGWSVNEAVAVGLGIGRTIAGLDCVVTMKIPGVFQAGDVISTSAFYPGSNGSGAFVIYAASDYVPSSTQHVIDARYFFASLRLPVLEPRNHQEMYDIARVAADISKSFLTPVIVLASGVLAHSEGLVTTKEPRIVSPGEVPADFQPWMLTPQIARENYDHATTGRIPQLAEWLEESPLVDEHTGDPALDWGIIASGDSAIEVKEALQSIGLDPPMLTLAAANPLPGKRIKTFAGKIKGRLFVFEDGDKFIQERLRLSGIDVTGKEEYSTITRWTSAGVMRFLAGYPGIRDRNNNSNNKSGNEAPLKPVKRPPSICPGCPYRAFALAVAKLKKEGKITASFGDIGCSTLLCYLGALDTVLCMGAGESIRQGFVLSRPGMAGRTISVTGDSCECHSGLDATRNAVFRNAAGVKVILDNSITAMTGGQPAPSSKTNLAGQPHKFSLKKAVAGEVERTVVVDSFNREEVERELADALDKAEKGEFTALILEGSCVNEAENRQKVRTIEFDYTICKNCGLCVMCPGIAVDDTGTPYFTALCNNCGGNAPVCMQYCKRDAIVRSEEETKPSKAKPRVPRPRAKTPLTIDRESLPESLRVAIRGIGGQGNLFFGKVLTQMAMHTPYSETHIVKGDTHGMARLGGAVISTFNCGNVFSPQPPPRSVDALVAMEMNEVLRPGFLELLKPGGTIILNRFSALPAAVKKEDYPGLSEIEKALKGYHVVTIDANQIAHGLGDRGGRTANAVVMGLLSTIEPFNRIPVGIWESALMSISHGDMIKSANLTAFEGGRAAG
jgi:indolepyruvate ferredoxin oxidoreductase alpha subunit